MANLSKGALRPKDLWIVGATFVATLMISVVAYIYAKNLDHARNQSRFEAAAKAIEHDLTAAMVAYGQVLRGGVALLTAKPDATRHEWRTYIASLELDQSYPGFQGVSYNAVLNSPTAAREFEDHIRRTDRPSFAIRPDGNRKLYTPVLFLEPLTPANEGAIGFDIYSEANRRETVDRAIASGAPNLTAKITLVQENHLKNASDVQAGLLLILPVIAPTHGAHPDASVTGLVVSVFRMGDLITDILRRAKDDLGRDVDLTLFDGVTDDPDAILYQTASDRLAPARYAASTRIELFGRTWSMTAKSTPAFERRAATYSTMLLLIAGVLVSILLSLLVWAQTVRYRDSLVAAESLREKNDRIVTLLGEVNHRSKNLLGVVQAIARQTSAQSPRDFAESFSLRLGALSASQDNLVKNNWAYVDLNDLVRAQLSHLADLIGDRIKVAGPEIRLSAAHAQTIGMALHELFTNACNYGALSNIVGQVEIGWEVDPEGGEDAQFRMWWFERRGPPVVAPGKTGFGSKVSTTMTEFALSGEVITSFEPSGFEWRLTCAASTIRNLPHSVSDDGQLLAGAKR